jgi:hypothetical protein
MVPRQRAEISAVPKPKAAALHARKSAPLLGKQPTKRNWPRKKRQHAVKSPARRIRKRKIKAKNAAK